VVTADRLDDLVTRVLAPNPSPMTLTGTNSYLVGRGVLVVVDPGPDLPEHVDALVETAAGLGTVAYSLVTHHHGDHLPAAARLRERIGAPIAGHRDLPGVDRALDDGEIVDVGGGRVRAVATPGHTADHLCFLLDPGRALFTGDLIAGSGTVIVGDRPGDLADYMASLRKVAELDPRLILPGHGPAVDDGSRKIQEYIDHRLLRERQVVGAIDSGARSVAEIVAVMYPDVLRTLRPMAARNVRAHLSKLEHEGRVAVTGGKWRLLDGVASP
jgi:glyoxylase-like metal-dependent hydrolase (beta-lactamase superfamily II)